MIRKTATADSLSKSILRVWLVPLIALFIAGCDLPAPPLDDAGSSPGDAQQQSGSDNTSSSNSISSGQLNPTSGRRNNDDENGSSGIKIARLGTTGSRSSVANDTLALDEPAAVSRLCEQFAEFASVQPVTVAWLFDNSATSEPITRAAAGAITDYYSAGNEVPFKSMIGSFGSETEWLLAEPANTSAEVAPAIDGLSYSGTEATLPFAAALAAMEQLSAARDAGQVTAVVLVTASPGDDWPESDAVVAKARETTTPIFVIGYPAPFGLASLSSGAMAPRGEAVVVRGPETPDPEFVSFQLQSEAPGPIIMDSGFGPWGLERICRAAGGSYLAIRLPASRFRMATGYGSGWPSDQAPRFDPTVMARYAPSYVDLAAYRERTSGNKAIKALLQVAERFPQIRTLQGPIVQFDARDQAQLKRELDLAQQPAALLSPIANQVQDILLEGEADREKLTDPRWQAAYDLALGQALAAVVRVDGYNGMLAQLKTGKTFQNPKSDVWTLESADAIDTTSLMRNKLNQAREILQKVIDEHPGTPWAHIAELELKSPLGYVWKELDTDRK